MNLLSVYPTDTPVIPGENPFLDQLLAEMDAKTKELEKLNAVAESFIYRFWDSCHSMRGLIWLAAACTLAVAFASPIFEASPGPIWVVVAIAAIIWAAWATSNPF